LDELLVGGSRRKKSGEQSRGKANVDPLSPGEDYLWFLDEEGVIEVVCVEQPVIPMTEGASSFPFSCSSPSPEPLFPQGLQEQPEYQPS